MVKLAVFDVDGVILDSAVEMISCINETLYRFGGETIPTDWYLNNQLGSFRDFVLSRRVPEKYLEVFLEDLDRTMISRSGRHRKREGIEGALRLVRARGLPLYLASACNRELTEAKIRPHRQLMEMVDGIYGLEEKSLVFKTLAEKYQIETSEIIFITDMPRDLKQAEAAGVTNNLVILNGGFCRVEHFAGYSYPMAETVDELITLLGEKLPNAWK